MGVLLEHITQAIVLLLKYVTFCFVSYHYQRTYKTLTLNVPDFNFPRSLFSNQNFNITQSGLALISTYVFVNTALYVHFGGTIS